MYSQFTQSRSSSLTVIQSLHRSNQPVNPSGRKRRRETENQAVGGLRVVPRRLLSTLRVLGLSFVCLNNYADDGHSICLLQVQHSLLRPLLLLLHPSNPLLLFPNFYTAFLVLLQLFLLALLARFRHSPASPFSPSPHTPHTASSFPPTSSSCFSCSSTFPSASLSAFILLLLPQQ